MVIERLSDPPTLVLRARELSIAAKVARVPGRDRAK
jgi:hypothetical protein